MKKERKINCLLLVILVIASVLRVYRLDSFPTGLNADEAAIGYNAYSLLQTGKDEFGHSWPLHFQSFNDFKPGLYFYLVLPLIKLIGLSVWAVRLPSAILGIAAVWLIYLLVKVLFPQEKLLAFFSALILTVSPWHLYFSRGGWEVNAATTFILVGIYFFLKALKNLKFFPFSLLFFIFSMYTYHSARLIAPLLFFGLVLINWGFIRSNFRKVFFSGILGVVVLIPLILSFIGPAGTARFSGVGLLADQGPFWRVNEIRGFHPNPNFLLLRLIHNRPLVYLTAFVKNWSDHYNGNFLFLSGDVIPRSRVPAMGQMYLVEVITVVLGIYFFLKKDRSVKLIFYWLAVAPVAAALTFQTPHALRSHNLVIPLSILSAAGIIQLRYWLKTKISLCFTKTVYRVSAVLLILVFLWSVAGWLHQYLIHYPAQYPYAWEEGFEELVDYLQPIAGNYRRVYVTDRYDQPYILFLFYLKYPPEQFQQEGQLTPRDQFGFSTVRNFDNYYFEAINWSRLEEERNILVVGTPEEIPDNANIIKAIKFSNNKIAFEIAEL